MIPFFFYSLTLNNRLRLCCFIAFIRVKSLQPYSYYKNLYNNKTDFSKYIYAHMEKLRYMHQQYIHINNFSENTISLIFR